MSRNIAILSKQIWNDIDADTKIYINTTLKIWHRVKSAQCWQADSAIYVYVMQVSTPETDWRPKYGIMI